MTVTTPEYTTESAPVAAPAAETPPPKEWSTGRIVAVAVGALVITILAAAGITYAIVNHNNPKALISACQDQVKLRLKSPATAKFPGADAVDESQTESTIVGAVDSQNAFGALVRTNYQCTLTKDNGGAWQISDVTVGQ